jgi:hypothetical protein
MEFRLRFCGRFERAWAQRDLDGISALRKVKASRRWKCERYHCVRGITAIGNMRDIIVLGNMRGIIALGRRERYHGLGKVRGIIAMGK